MKLSIILLTYNSQSTIIGCLSSLVRNYSDELKHKKYEIIVVDNNSQDETIKEVKNFLNNKDIPLSIFQNDENLGFAKGINYAAEVSKGEYLLILNPDTEVLNAGLNRAIAYMDEDSKTGVIGGKLVTPTKSIEKSTGRDFNFLHIFLLTLSLDNALGMRSAPGKLKEVDWVSGGCMVIRKKLFTDLNGFDERYFMYVEDADLCRRVRDMGYRVIYLPEFEVLHESHASSSREFAITQIYKGLKLYSKKFSSPLSQFLIKFLLTAKAESISVGAKVVGNEKTASTYSKASKEI